MKSHNPPRSLADRLYLFFSGLCMGAADVVPGVSGGTMAFILGVYEDLLDAIHAFNADMIRDLLARRFRDFFARIPFQFLLFLVGGIAMAILLLAGIIKDLYENQQILLFAFFFGLILASIRTLSAGVSWNLFRFLFLLAGAALGWLVVTLTPQQMPQTPLILFGSGSVAIMAMILPGISGAFILLILGQYAWVLEQIDLMKTALKGLDVRGIFEVGLALLPVALGALIGLLAFARLLRWILRRAHNATMAVLIGFMAGSLRRIWPWREPVDVAEFGEKTVILSDRMFLPALEREVWAALALMLFGIILVTILERIQTRKSAL